MSRIYFVSNSSKNGSNALDELNRAVLSDFDDGSSLMNRAVLSDFGLLCKL